MFDELIIIVFYWENTEITVENYGIIREVKSTHSYTPSIQAKK